MRRHRTTARGTLLSLLLASLVAASASPSATGAGEAVEAVEAVPQLVFPLVAKTALWDNYGDPRGHGPHAGIDMENPWRAPVVAVEAGKVRYWRSRLGGCMLYLYGRSGTTYLYIHLNDDLTPRSDNRGGCVRGVAFAVPNGASVAAGELVGYNGDSGDAAGNPHLHFEVHPRGGRDVNPFRHLQRAARPLFAGRLGATFSLGLRGRILAAGEGSVQMEVERVRHYPGGRWLDVDARVVELVVPAGARVGPALGDVSPARRVLARPLPATAFTLRAKVTADALAGLPGSLTAARVAPGR